MKNKFYKNKKNIVMIILILFLIGFLIFRIISSIESKKVEIVTSSSKFYTVSNCVSRYIYLLYSEDIDNLLLVLDNSYEKDNKVTKNNLLDKIGKLDSLYSFEARKIYQQEVNDDVIKYYVFGYLKKETLDYVSDDEKKDFYLIVLLNSKKMTYSIIPYNGEIFVKEVNDERK